MFEIRPQGTRMKIRIIAEKKDLSVSSFRMEEPDGDYTEFFLYGQEDNLWRITEHCRYADESKRLQGESC